MGIFTDQELVQKIVRERFGENTGDALAKKISDKMGDVFETMRDRFNRNGGDIGKLDNWGLPQTHNLEKIAKAGKEAWVSKAESLIDTRQYVHENGDYYSQQEIRSLLEYTYDTLSSDGANKIEVGRQATGGGTSKVTNRHSESRVLHFKDAESWLEYQSEFGGMQFVDLVEAHINGLSKDIAMVENLGSNPKTALKILMDAAAKKDWEKGIEENQTKSSRKRAQVMFDEFSGGNTPQSQVLANLGIAYRSMNVASMLGGTTIASLADQATIAKTAHVHNLSYRKAFGGLIEQLNPANKADRELAHSLGLATEEMLGSIAGLTEPTMMLEYSPTGRVSGLGPIFQVPLSGRPNQKLPITNEVTSMVYPHVVTKSASTNLTENTALNYGDGSWTDIALSATGSSTTNFAELSNLPDSGAAYIGKVFVCLLCPATDCQIGFSSSGTQTTHLGYFALKANKKYRMLFLSNRTDGGTHAPRIFSLNGAVTISYLPIYHAKFTDTQAAIAFANMFCSGAL